MRELTTTGHLVERETLEPGGALTAILERSELEAARASGEAAQLWLELGLAGDDEAARLTIDLGPADLEEILRRSDEDTIALALDGEVLASVIAEPEVEAHGLRGALAIAVTSAAVLAPAGLAAVPQSVDAATTAQRVSSATTSQAVPAATTQVSTAQARAQVSRSLVAKGQVAKGQVSKNVVLKAYGLQLLRGGLAR